MSAMLVVAISAVNLIAFLYNVDRKLEDLAYFISFYHRLSFTKELPIIKENERIAWKEITYLVNSLNMIKYCRYRTSVGMNYSRK